MDLQNKENARKIMKKKTTNKGGEENKSNSTETNHDVITKPKGRKAKDDDKKKKKRRKKATNEEEESNSNNSKLPKLDDDEKKRKEKKKKKNVGGEDRQQSDGERSAATIKYAIRGGIEREFRFLKRLKTVEELENFTFKHGCSFNSVKRNPKFSTVTLACNECAPSRKGCLYKLLAKRPNLEHGEIIKVYAHGEHNHTMKSEANRSYRGGQRNVLIPDKDPPPTQRTPDGLEWIFQRTVANVEALNECRIENYCKNGSYWNVNPSQYRLRCNDAYKNTHCSFMMLAWKTIKQRFHIYINGQHTCANRTKNQRKSGKKRNMSTGERGSKPSKRSRREEEEEMDAEKDGNMEAEQTEEEDDGPREDEAPPVAKEYPLEKIQRRLGHSLRKGQAERAHKWMERVGMDQIDTILTGMDLENVVKMMEMADRELNEDRERSRDFWRPWIKEARQNHGSALAQIPNLVDRFSSRYLCRKLARTIREEDDGRDNTQ